MANVSAQGNAIGLAIVTGVGKSSTKNLTTAAGKSLIAYTLVQNGSAANAAAVAEIANSILGDNTRRIVDGSFTQGGFLHIPGRGNLQVFPGDVVAVDDYGWPILISKNSIANGHDWTLA